MGSENIFCSLTFMSILAIRLEIVVIVVGITGMLLATEHNEGQHSNLFASLFFPCHIAQLVGLSKNGNLILRSSENFTISSSLTHLW